jgi:formylglycine-generating enzyme required for sulfatase activity
MPAATDRYGLTWTLATSSAKQTTSAAAIWYSRRCRGPKHCPTCITANRQLIQHQPLPPTFKNGIGMEFVIVPKGKCWLGGGNGKLGDTEVLVPSDFYVDKFEVTQEEWEKVMGENLSYFSRTRRGIDAAKDITNAGLKRFPVETVSWDNGQLFEEKLNRREKEPGWVYRLPKSAEWEYACRGGPQPGTLDSAFDFYFVKPTNTLLPEQANFIRGLKRTCAVGCYEPNALSLHDMHVNVWEWCDDPAKSANGDSGRVNRGAAGTTPPRAAGRRFPSRVRLRPGSTTSACAWPEFRRHKRVSIPGGSGARPYEATTGFRVALSPKCWPLRSDPPTPLNHTFDASAFRTGVRRAKRAGAGRRC